MNTNIIFSERACVYIHKMLEKSKGNVFRLTIKKTGCSGYSYSPAITDKVDPEDFIIATNYADLKIYIDAAWVHLFQGLQVDYIEEEKSGLKQKRLVFINPNESSRCGCGESFHIEG